MDPTVALSNGALQWQGFLVVVARRGCRHVRDSRGRWRLRLPSESSGLAAAGWQPLADRQRHSALSYFTAQFSTASPLNGLKSFGLAVTTGNPFVTAIAAICPSTNGGVFPSFSSRTRSSACHSAAALRRTAAHAR